MKNDVVTVYHNMMHEKNVIDEYDVLNFVRLKMMDEAFVNPWM